MTRVRLTVAGLALVFVVPLVITGVMNIRGFQQAYRTKTESELRGMVERHSLIIDSFIDVRLSDVRIIAREHPIDRLRDPAFLGLILNLLREEYHGAFVDLGLVDRTGRQIAYAGPYNLSMVDYSSSGWFDSALARESSVSDVFSGLRGAPHFIITTQRLVGDELFIVRATIDFEAFNELVENLSVGDTGFAFIVNRNGEFQTTPRDPVRLEDEPYAGLFKSDELSGRINVSEGAGGDGRSTLFATAPLKNGEWLLCFQQEVRDAYAEMRGMSAVAVTSMILATIGTLAASVIFARYLAARVAEADHKSKVMTHQVFETGRLASIGELAAGIAHEVNNPVAIMVQEAGWIEDLLAEENPGSEESLKEIYRAAAQIQTQGDRCREITYKLLSFARKTDPTVHEVDLNEFVADVLGLTSPKTRYGKFNLATDLTADLPMIKASPSEVQQILLNLVNNAIDATEGTGGTVTIATRSDDKTVILEVRDTGSGIADSDLERIFDPFFTTKPVGEGTGLGLSICYGIVDKMGGRITVESELGFGTAFTVFFPLAAGSSATQPHT